jgi:ferrous iron transport protein B
LINSVPKQADYEIGIIGNPNVGKTLIFNYLTGSHQKVANFPGVTVKGKSGNFNLNRNKYQLTDLPGIYGFSSGKPDEAVTHNFLLSSNLDLIINVIDASKLERNLFLTLQLLELHKNMIIVLNFMDKVDQNRTEIDIDGLQRMFGVPVIPVSAVKKTGLETLQEKIEFAIHHPFLTLPIVLEEFDPILEDLFDRINLNNLNTNPKIPPKRWLILSTIFLGIPTHDVLTKDDHDQIIDALNAIEQKYLDEKADFQLTLFSNLYDKIQEIISAQVVFPKERNVDKLTWSDRMDKILLHSVFGFIIFFIIMGLVFVFTFEISAPLSDGLESTGSNLSEFISRNVSNELWASFLADGLIGGVGFVLVFIPQIAILFIFLSILEHTGYMARVVFITDRFVNKLGISGKSIAPMLLGFGCNLPAIMSTNNISDHNERITIALVNPFLPCSARFPVFIILSSAIFGKFAGIVVTGLYFTGILVSLVMMYILRKTVLKGETTDLLLEINDLTLPPISAVWSQVYRQLRKFIETAATWMALGLIIMWFLSITGPSGYLGPEALNDEAILKKSWVYAIGDTIQPVFGIFGWDARIVTALIFGFVAKEIVIGSLGIIYGVGGDLTALESILAAQFTPVSAIALMVYVLAYIPCIGTYFVLRQEVGSKWANFSILNGLIIAFSLAITVTFVGGLLV